MTTNRVQCYRTYMLCQLHLTAFCKQAQLQGYYPFARGLRGIITETAPKAKELPVNSLRVAMEEAPQKSASKTFAVDPFCLRQFSHSYAGTHIPFEPSKFEKIINEEHEKGELQLCDGYAPFCKHLFVENFTDATVGDLPITPENEKLLRTEYEARTPKELPVLSRYFSRGQCEVPKAKYLDVICYSREQINEENKAMGNSPNPETAPWGIISIKGQDIDSEIPMQPITIMRNSLGKDQGGSGVPLIKEKYMESVEYWSCHAPLK